MTNGYLYAASGAISGPIDFGRLILTLPTQNLCLKSAEKIIGIIMTTLVNTSAENVECKPASQPGRNPRIRVGEKVYLRKRGKAGKYVAEFWHSGQNCKKAMGTADRQIATRRALKLEVELLAGTYAAELSPVTIESAVSDYLECKRGEDRAAKTIVKYREWLDSFVQYAKDHRATTLQQITPRLFESFRAFRKPNQSPKSMYTGLTILKSFVKWCASPSRGYLQTNPIADCKVPKPYAHPKFSPSRKQVSKILKAASGARRAQYALLAYTGLRAGEMQMLRPQDVDFTAGWIHIVGRPGWIPKTCQARDVPIHPLLLDQLNAYLAKLHKAASTRPYFFCAPSSTKFPNGDHTIDLRKLNVRFQELAMSLSYKTGRCNNGLVIHSLRHFFETQAVNSLIPQLVVDAWMGHAGSGSMAKVYYGRSKSKSRKFMKQVRFVNKLKLQPQPVSAPVAPPPTI